MPLPTPFNPLPIAQIALIVWLVWIAVHDFKTSTIPAWSTWPVILGACAWQLLKGAWAPLVLFTIYFAWDTTVGDLKRLRRQPIGPEDDGRWLVPDPVAYLASGAAILLANSQGQAAAVFTAVMVVVHQLWRMQRLPGGDAALLIALAGVYPSLDFLLITAAAIATLTLPRLAWKYRHDLLLALKMALTGSPLLAVPMLAEATQRKSQVEPVAYIFSAAGIVTTALFWVR